MKNVFDRVLAGLMVVAVVAFLVIGMKPQSSDASIGNMTAQLGVYNSTDKTYGLEVDNNNQFHFGMTGAGIYYGITSITTETTLTALQTGQTFVSTAVYGAVTTPGASEIICLLPTAIQGMDFTYIAGTTEEIQLIPQSTDTIEYSTITAGQALYNTSGAKGDHLELRASAANTWQVYDIQGTWAHGTP